jgi:outer membrane receptor protein involved in Fe transport
MRGSIRTKIIQQTFKSTLLAGLALGLIPFAGSNALAQGSAILEEIVVTATRREESLQDVPISVATMSGERLNSLFTGGEDVLALDFTRSRQTVVPRRDFICAVSATSISTSRHHNPYPSSWTRS